MRNRLTSILACSRRLLWGSCLWLFMMAGVEAHDDASGQAARTSSGPASGLETSTEAGADNLRLKRQLARARADLQLAHQARRALETELVRLRSELRIDKTNHYALGRYGNHANPPAHSNEQAVAVDGAGACPPR